MSNTITATISFCTVKICGFYLKKKKNPNMYEYSIELDVEDRYGNLFAFTFEKTFVLSPLCDHIQI